MVATIQMDSSWAYPTAETTQKALHLAWKMVATIQMDSSWAYPTAEKTQKALQLD
jgi:hypothetical protein